MHPTGRPKTSRTGHGASARPAARGVWVTGRGIVVGGTNDLASIWNEVREDRPLLEASLDATRLASAARVSKADASVLARHQMLAIAAVEDAWREAGLPEDRNPIRGEGPKHRRRRFACVAGSSLGGLVAMDREIAVGDVSALSISRWRGNAIDSAVSIRFGLGGGVHALNAASATGAQVLLLAGTLVQTGLADLVVAVGADVAPSSSVLAAMERTGSTSPSPLSRPLTSSRSGMRPVEGAACILLESAAHARRRGAVPIATWLGGTSASEAHHLVAPNDDAEALRECLEEARSIVGRSSNGADRVMDWVSLHATGTRRFDPIEIEAVRSVFSPTSPWISAFKRTTGHAQGAAGLVEAVLVTEGLRRGERPRWPHDADPAMDLAPPAGAEAKPLRSAALIGQGMGGAVVVNVLRVFKSGGTRA